MYFMIKVSQLKKTFVGGVQALRGIDLEILPGQTVAVVGESGCGKSTLAKHILNLEKPTSGKIELHNTLVENYSAKELAKKVQMIFQDPASSLNPRRKIKAILAEPLEVQKEISKDKIFVKVAEMLSAVGLRPEVADRYPHMLSGGQKQRVGIARALMTGAQTIICDEPVSALDVSVQAQVLNLLKDLQKDFGLAYLFISHDLGVVRFIADVVHVMYLGKIVESGTAEQIFTDPQHPYTKLLLQSTPVIGRQAIDIAAGAAELPSPKNPPPGCAFRARCGQSIEKCQQTDPVLVYSEKRAWACHAVSEVT
jgi:dipeptide transport system ATP-binding protein